MNILNSPPQSPLTQAQVIALQFKKDAYLQFYRLVQNYENGLHRFWRNYQATPQEISDALGTDAVSVFTLHGITKHIIMQAKPDQALSAVSDFGTYEANEDGTITILSVIEPPAEVEEE